MRPQFARLGFLDKMCYERAFDWFRSPASASTTNEEETNFLLSLLDSGKNFEEATVRNAINFARSWAELGRIPDRQVLSRILYLSFLSSAFVNQLVGLADLTPSQDWIFHGLFKITTHDFSIVTASIETDAAIWSFLCDRLLADAQSKPIDYSKRYCERDDDSAFLIESLVLGWRWDRTVPVPYAGLVEAVSRFCVECRSATGLKLLGALCHVFPHTAGPLAVSVVGGLPSTAVILLLRMDLIPPAARVGKEFAMKALRFSKELALAALNADQEDEGKEAVLTIIKRFVAEDDTIHIA
jgi:hypothetical protein